jgi:hypothetical protein
LKYFIGSDVYLLLQKHHEKFMITLLGKNNHPLSTIGAITPIISHFTSSCMEKIMIIHSTTFNERLSCI